LNTSTNSDEEEKEAPTGVESMIMRSGSRRRQLQDNLTSLIFEGKRMLTNKKSMKDLKEKIEDQYKSPQFQ
jgi:predicted nuclease of restriction endonuclease-like (RecB) superfamily